MNSVTLLENCLGSTKPDLDAGVTAIHLDALGGVAGDMCSAALLDILPDLWAHCKKAIMAMDLSRDVSCDFHPHTDGTLLVITVGEILSAEACLDNVILAGPGGSALEVLDAECASLQEDETSFIRGDANDDPR